MATRQCPLPALTASEPHARAFRSLGHLSRLRVFFHLVRAGGEVPAGEIQKAVRIPAATLSHHLDRLRRAGLLQSRRQDRHIYYRVDSGAVRDLVRLLTACC